MTDYLEPSEFQKSRAVSPAVITQGGRTVWLAGQTATRDADGRDISGDFDAQAKTIFALIDATMPAPKVRIQIRRKVFIASGVVMLHHSK